MIEMGVNCIEEKEIKMSQEKSQLKVGIILSYLNVGAGSLVGILYTPVMLNLLGQSEYGLYKLSSNVTSYLSLMSLGLSTAIVRYLIKSRVEEGKDSEQRMLGLFMLIFNIIAVVTFFCGLIIVYIIPFAYSESLTNLELSRMQVLVFLMVCNMSLTFTMTPLISVVNAHEKFRFYQSMNLLSTVIIPIVNIIVLLCGGLSVGMATSSLVISFVTRIMYLIYVRKSLQIKAAYKGLPLKQLKEIINFSVWIFVANITAQLYNATDTVLIGMISDLSLIGVAVYNVGIVFNNIVLNLTTVISSILSPQVNRMVFEGNKNIELNKLIIKVGRLQSYFVFLLVSGFVVFGQPFIKFYAGEGYEDAYWVAIFMLLPSIIPLVQSVCVTILVAKNRHKFRSIVYLGIAILNVFGTWILLQCLGIIGAALMTGVSLIIGQGFVMNWYYYRKENIDIVAFGKSLSKIAIVSLIMCITACYLSHILDFYDFITFVISVIIYTIIYILVQWLISFNCYEKELILRLLKKIRRVFNR